MSDRRAPRRRGGPILLCLLLCALPAPAARAEPAVQLLDLPFKVRAMRGPRSEAAVSVATSGLLPVARAKVGQESGDEESAPIAVVWGEDGGAVLTLDEGAVTIRPIGREAVEGLTAAETPRGALPGSRRALAGPLSAYLTGRTRAPDGGTAAAVLTIRERQSMAVSADPKPVPVATVTVPAGGEAVFAPLRPRVLRLSGRPALLAATFTAADAGGLVLVTHPGGDPAAAWTVTARTPPQSGPPLKIAGIADYSGTGATQVATVSARGLVQLWTLGPDRIEVAGEAAGYAAGEGDADLAATLVLGGPPELAVPVAGTADVAILQAKGGLRERLRVRLPAPAAAGIVVLGEGAAARLLVGLSDGRVALVVPEGGRPVTEAIPDPDGRLFPARPLVGVSIAVIRGERVLLAARANEPMRGVWTLPGGLVEAGERLAAAALRELSEEVGLSAEVVGVLTPTEIIVPDATGRTRHHYVVHPHAALWTGGEPEAGPEALDVRWASLAEAAALPATPGLVDTLREAFARARSAGVRA